MRTYPVSSLPNTNLTNSQPVKKQKRISFSDTINIQCILSAGTMTAQEPIKDHSLADAPSETILKTKQSKLAQHERSLEQIIAIIKTLKSLTLDAKNGWIRALQDLLEKIRPLDTYLATHAKIESAARKTITQLLLDLEKIPLVNPPSLHDE